MTPEEADGLLSEVEQQLQTYVQTLLDNVSAEFLADVNGATELVAAAFSVSSIRDMWRRRVPQLMARLTAFARRSAAVTAQDLGESKPTQSELDAVLGPYQDATRPLVEAVGDHLAEAATAQLADGVSAGENLDQLKARMSEVFGPNGAQLGPVRAARISQTEANRAYNAGVQAAAESLEGPDRPLVKQWVTRHDTHVREAHRAADGQLRLLTDPFDVGGSEMMYPGDPAAPADLTINCRCLMVATAPPRPEGNNVSASSNSLTADGDWDGFAPGDRVKVIGQPHLPGQDTGTVVQVADDVAYAVLFDGAEEPYLWYLGSELAYEDVAVPGSDGEQLPPGMSTAADYAIGKMPRQLKDYWLRGEGALKIGWGTPGQFDRCVSELRKYFPQDPKGLCAELYHDANGRWPGQQRAATEHSGAMVALMPSAVDASRLGAFADESADDLHMTLFYLGDGADWNPEARDEVHRAVSAAAEWCSPVIGRAFGVAHWNGDGDNPAWVWNVGDHPDWAQPQTLADVHREVRFALEDRHGESPDMPAQFSPWAPHVAFSYGDVGHPSDVAGALGPITFDRIRVAFAGEYVDFPLTGEGGVPDTVSAPQEAPAQAAWSTPAPAALAFENQQTGDGRVFAPGALYWDGPGPWPLMANENFDSHDNAALAGAIQHMNVDGDRLVGQGVLYLTQPEGANAALLLAQGAPLGVSVDLDDVDIEMVDASGGESAALRAKLVRASLLPMPEGGFVLAGETEPVMLASGTTLMTESQRIRWHVGPNGLLPASAFEVVAAAGDTDYEDGVVVDQQRSGDYLMRITRGRVRGATLVSVPAYADARIVLDNPGMFASAVRSEELNAAAHTSDYDRVLRHVRRSKSPSGPGRIAQFLKIPISAVKRHLSAAASKGEVVQLTRGLYTDHTSFGRADHRLPDQPVQPHPGDADVLSAAVTGGVDLPVAPNERPWDGAAAEARVFEWADGDCQKLDQAFAYRDESLPCDQKNAHKLGFADIVDGELTIIPRGVFAAQGALNGARGTGVDIPGDQKSDVAARLDQVRAHVDEVNGQGNMDEMQASAWAALGDLPAMPAAWFREPTAEELPPGAPGVNYANGRIFGWVAQSNVPHAGYTKRVVINELGRIDTTEFLRQRFTLDDGSTVKAGAFTMNAGHHRDGAECETAACQFDDTRTVAGIITVGMNERGMWFSGAAAPWLSEWDRQVFAACQPSYHMKRAANGTWKLGAVLSVPVPGHPSALLASAVIDRGQMALTASALVAETEAAVKAEQARQRHELAAAAPAIDYAALAAAIVDEQDRRNAELAELIAAAGSMDGDTTEGM